MADGQDKKSKKAKRAFQEAFIQDCKEMETDSASGDMVESSDEDSAEYHAWEEAIRDEARSWLANAGRAMFSLECQRFLVNERKRQEQSGKR